MKVVAFPYHDWRKSEEWGFRNRDLHLLRGLADHPAVDDILVVDRPVSAAERLVRRRRPFVQGSVVSERSARRRTDRITRVHPRTAVLDILVPDLFGPLLRQRSWWFDIFRDPGVLESIEWALASLDIDESPVIAWTPTVAGAIRRLRPTTFVYDSLDNWITHPTLRRNEAQARAAYAELLPRASTVIAPSPASQAILREWAADVVVVQNGVDSDWFARPRDRPADLPAGPVVGYTGTLGVRLDPDLVGAVADRSPDVTFVFVGPIRERESIRAMLGRPNVVLLGERHYDVLPSYLQHFDIGWIPHRVGEGETGGDPIKTYEYWAAGLQVVSTRLDGFDQWADQMHFMANADDGARIIRGLLDGTVAKRPVEIPRDRTWTAITEVVADLLGASPRG